MAKRPLTIVEEYAVRQMLLDGWSMEKMAIHLRRDADSLKKELIRKELIASTVKNQDAMQSSNSCVADRMVRRKGITCMTAGGSIKETATKNTPDRTDHLYRD